MALSRANCGGPLIKAPVPQYPVSEKAEYKSATVGTESF